MRPRTKASLLWGVVGGMTFLVLAQGYRLVAPFDPGYPTLFGVALVVTAAAAGAAHVVAAVLR